MELKKQKRLELRSRQVAEREKVDRKNAQIALNIENTTKAKSHRNRILKQKIISAFRQNVENRQNHRENILRAMKLRKIRPFFISWKNETKRKTEERIRIADSYRYQKLLKRYRRRFFRVQTSVHNLTPLMIFLKRRASYHFKAYEFRNLLSLEFFVIIDEIVF